MGHIEIMGHVETMHGWCAPWNEAAFIAALTEGGDSRLLVDPATGTNRYFVPPAPVTGGVCFSSCTASPISEAGYRQAMRCYVDLVPARSRDDAAERRAAWHARVTATLANYLHLNGLADILLVPSGTDGLLLCSILNANCGGRDHAPVMVERQVIRWAAEMLGLPLASSGLVVGGPSTANLVAVLVARTAVLSARVRKWGVGDSRLVAYPSEAAHMCIARALDFAGVGSDALVLIPCDTQGRMDPDALSERIMADRRAGVMPLMVVGTAGSVDTGAIDPLDRIAAVCRERGVWFHVDGAFGALACLSRPLRPLLAGIEAADSVAFDFHKWAQVPYDAGCIVVRDAVAHRAAFARTADYLRTADRGLAAGAPWPVDLGPELSRGFRALKVWMTLSVYGADRLGAVVERCVDLARRLALAIDQAEDLELAAPAGLNVVCFRVRGFDDAGHDALVADMQESGACVLSTTTIGGRRVLRAAFVNHRTAEGDVDALLADVRAAAAEVISRCGDER